MTVEYGPTLPLTPPLPRAPQAAGDILPWAQSMTLMTAQFYRSLAKRADGLTVHGTLAQRPAPTGTRRIYFATDVPAFYYDDGAWVTIAAGGATSSTSVDETPSGTVNGVNATFTLAQTPLGGKLFLYVSSIGKCWEGVHYTLSGNTITFLAGNIPQTGDLLSATYNY